jgi:TetR/AcrR family transcriptional regulator, transcriptional repressor for nem operon
MASELSPTAAQIVASARALLSTRGYDGFSYADIAATVGISKASIHHHFPSKAELVRRVVEAYRAEALDGMAALRDQVPDPVARLQAWTHYLQTCIRDGSLPFCICAMLATEMATIPDAVGAVVRGHFDDLSGWLAVLLAEGARSGQFRLHAAAPAEALALMASIHGAMISARAYKDPALFAAISDSLVARLAATH